MRLGGGVAVHLQLLFSHARFVFVVRNPYDSYLSYRTQTNRRGNPDGWYHAWPHDRVGDPAHFARIWRGLADSIQRCARRVRGVVVQYEQLGDAETVEQLMDGLGLDVRTDRTQTMVGSSFDDGRQRRALSAYGARGPVRCRRCRRGLRYYGPTPRRA